ncbi:OapA family protein [Candidatus Pantoea multigeneris]|uniref:Opacity-associated protein A n=1 Tax=Candidatus Pantoea multigeneris TaxID=2608357 RepID=A0ABX0R7R2_9GAMM|nr:LysM-like peptidoglycan-binding domain-containing protein [Pantoea multigeneris]NIF21406.1 Opacity-associated protein A [Pantoea multigeneris]
MGQIAPRRRRTRTARTLPRLPRLWPVSRSRPETGEEEVHMATRSPSRFAEWLYRFWHFTDGIRWMDPLPYFHRRGIIIALVVILLAFLWPSGSPQQFPVTTPVTSDNGKEVPMQADIYNNSSNSKPQADSQGNWRSYTIAAGQTLAQLFRDNNLPVGDVFAMANVEGSDHPLSALQTGQQVKIRLNNQGQVTGLTVDGSNGPVLFTRQADGSFIRAQ